MYNSHTPLLIASVDIDPALVANLQIGFHRQKNIPSNPIYNLWREKNMKGGQGCISKRDIAHNFRLF